MDRWMDRWMDGWMDRWMDGWMDGCGNKSTIQLPLYSYASLVLLSTHQEH